MRTVLTLLLLMITAAQVYAKTITVMKDGNGDFSLLQPAADSAAPGDTILIGPGRWLEVTEFYFNSGVRRDAHLVVRVDDLTIMGTSNEEVIIGPTVLNDLGGYPVGTVVAEDISTTRIETMSFENLYSGIFGLGDLAVSRCAVRDCMFGLFVVGSVSIVQSVVLGATEDGIFISSLAGESVIRDCSLESCRWGVTVNRPQGRCDVFNTVIEGGRVGIQFDQALGSLQGSIVRGVEIVGVAVTTGASVELSQNVMEDNGQHIDVVNRSTLQGTQNTLGRFITYGIWMGSPGTFVWNGNDHLYSAQYQIYVSGHSSPEPVHYDFTDNYWGTADSSTISDNIYDLNDDINVRAVIDFSPFSEGPVPVEGSSVGGLKARFRSR